MECVGHEIGHGLCGRIASFGIHSDLCDLLLSGGLTLCGFLRGVLNVMRDGRIVEAGSHEVLMAGNGLYAELFSLQAGAYL